MERKEKRENDGPKHKVLKTTAVYLAFVGMGMGTTSVPPSIVLIEIILDTDIKTIGVVLMAGGFGYLFGTLFAGVIIDRINRDICFIVTSVMIGASLMLLISIKNIWAFGFFNALRAVGMGIQDAGGQAYLLDLWLGTKFKFPCMQALHCLWSLGSTVGPFVIRFFIVDLPASANQTDASINVTLDYNDTSDFVSTDYLTDIYFVRFGFIVIGGFMIFPTVLFSVILVIEKPTWRHKKRTISETKSEKKIKSKFSAYILVFITATFFLFYLVMEEVPGTYGAAYAIKGFGWDVQTGALITSIFWGGLGVGRLLGIPLSMCFKPRKMLICSFVVSTTAYIMLTFFSSYHDTFIWISFGVSGLALSTMFASMMLLISDFIEVSGLVASILFSGASVGGLSGVPIAGYMFQTYSHMWVAYIALGGNIMCILLLTLQYIVIPFLQKRELVTDVNVSQDHELANLQTINDSHNINGQISGEDINETDPCLT